MTDFELLYAYFNPLTKCVYVLLYFLTVAVGRTAGKGSCVSLVQQSDRTTTYYPRGKTAVCPSESWNADFGRSPQFLGQRLEKVLE